MGKRWDKNRHRKIYPVMRRSPLWLPDIEAISVEFAVGETEKLSATTKYQYANPTVTLGGEDNYNIWIAQKNDVGDNRYTFLIKRSTGQASAVQEVFLHISETG